MLGIGLKLLGIGKAIIGWILGIIQAIFNFCKSHPLMALAILIDVILIYGCVWGYAQHRDSLDKDVKITALHKTVKEKDSLIEKLYKRIDEYVEALKESQEKHVATIKRNNAAVDHIKEAADEQLAAAQREAVKNRHQRDQYFQLAEKYRSALNQGGTPEERIAREEQINQDFIREFKGIK